MNYRLSKQEFIDLYGKHERHYNRFSYNALDKIFEILEENEENFNFDFEVINNMFMEFNNVNEAEANIQESLENYQIIYLNLSVLLMS